MNLNVITSSSNRLNIIKNIIPRFNNEFLELLNITNVPIEIQKASCDMIIVSDALDTTDYIYNAYSEALSLWIYSVMYNKDKSIDKYIALLKQKIDFTDLDITNYLKDFKLKSMILESKYKPSDYLKGDKEPLLPLVLIIKDLLNFIKKEKTPIIINTLSDLELFIKNDFILNNTSFRKIIIYTTQDISKSFAGIIDNLNILRLYTSGFDYNTQSFVTSDKDNKILYLDYKSDYNKYSKKLSIERYFSCNFDFYAKINYVDKSEKEYTEFVDTLLKTRCVYGSLDSKGSIDLEKLISNNLYLMRGISLPSMFGSEFVDININEFKTIEEFLNFISKNKLNKYTPMKENLQYENSKLDEFLDLIYFENNTILKWVEDAESINNLDDKEPMYFKGLINHIFRTYKIVTEDIFKEIFTGKNSVIVSDIFNTDNKLLITNILRSALETFYLTKE